MLERSRHVVKQEPFIDVLSGYFQKKVHEESVRKDAKVRVDSHVPLHTMSCRVQLYSAHIYLHKHPVCVYKCMALGHVLYTLIP